MKLLISMTVEKTLVYGGFPAWCSRRDSTAGWNSESFRVTLFLSKPETVCLQTILHDIRTLKNVGCLGTDDTILLFLDIFQQTSW